MAKPKQSPVPKSDYRWRMGFSKGQLVLPNGKPARVVKAKEFLSSNNLTKYTAALWSSEDASELKGRAEEELMSCNCTGWATHRRCKHLEELKLVPKGQIVRLEGETLQAEKATPEVVASIGLFDGRPRRAISRE